MLIWIVKCSIDSIEEKKWREKLKWNKKKLQIISTHAYKPNPKQNMNRIAVLFSNDFDVSVLNGVYAECRKKKKSIKTEQQ